MLFSHKKNLVAKELFIPVFLGDNVTFSIPPFAACQIKRHSFIFAFRQMSIDRQTSLCVNLSAFMYVFTWRLYVHSIVIAARKLALTSNVSVCLAMWRLSQTRTRTRTQHVRHAMSMTKNHTQPPATTRHHQIHTHTNKHENANTANTHKYTQKSCKCVDGSATTMKCDVANM